MKDNIKIVKELEISKLDLYKALINVLGLDYLTIEGVEFSNDDNGSAVYKLPTSSDWIIITRHEKELIAAIEIIGASLFKKEWPIVKDTIDKE